MHYCNCQRGMSTKVSLDYFIVCLLYFPHSKKGHTVALQFVCISAGHALFQFKEIGDLPVTFQLFSTRKVVL